MDLDRPRRRHQVDSLLVRRHSRSGRLAHRVQLATDGHKPYLTAVADAFGRVIDYVTLTKFCGLGPKTEARYSPAQCMGARKAVVSGKPEHAHVSTSYVERHNLTICMGNRRFTRLTNAFSKKVENHEHMLALFFMYYKICRIHQSSRVTPAMEAGVANHVWSLSEVSSLIARSGLIAA